MSLRFPAPMCLLVTLLAGACTEPAAPPDALDAGSAAFLMAGPRPFHGGISGSIHAVQPFAPGSDPACNANFTGDPAAPGPSISLYDEAHGRWSHMGNSHLGAVSCIDPASPFSSGHGVIRAANGDLLLIAFDNFGLPDAADPSRIEVTGTQWITGGTGRFADASGTQDCVFTIRLHSPAAGSIVGECRGTIAY